MAIIAVVGIGGFLPGVKQIANVASLPGIVGVSTILGILCHVLFSYLLNVLHNVCTWSREGMLSLHTYALHLKPYSLG